MSGPHNLILFAPFFLGMSAAAQGEPAQPAQALAKPEIASPAEEPADIAAGQAVTSRGPQRTDQKAAEIDSQEGIYTDLKGLSWKAQFRSGPHHVPK